eukprot:SAG31_NODE_21691_length_543_cov_0.914414_1_plen_122_part_00
MGGDAMLCAALRCDAMLTAASRRRSVAAAPSSGARRRQQQLDPQRPATAVAALLQGDERRTLHGVTERVDLAVHAGHCLHRSARACVPVQHLLDGSAAAGRPRGTATVRRAGTIRTPVVGT